MGNTQVGRCFTPIHHDNPKHRLTRINNNPRTRTTMSIEETQNFTCEFCVESKPIKQAFNIKGCHHFYCRKCTRSYITSRLEENITTINCPQPECPGQLDPYHCRSILPKSLYAKWGTQLCESAIPDSNKLYCPYKSCSGLILKEQGPTNLTKAKCPYCKKKFCVRCKVPWHKGKSCAKDLGDPGLSKLAFQKNWKTCPNCGHLIERRSGCVYLRCRCKHAFCFQCGADLTQQTYHNCKSCGSFF